MITTPSLPPKSGVPHLEVHLSADVVAMIPMTAVREVVTIAAGQVVPVPNMPSCVLGTANCHNRLYWLVDLPQLLTVRTLDVGGQRYAVVLVEVKDQALALAVPEIRGITRLEAVFPPLEALPHNLNSYVLGCTLGDPPRYVLNVEAILKSPVLQL
ncbi:MAG: chemotaxis protein CheW [Pseudanabaenaceae cyanobacterium]